VLLDLGELGASNLQLAVDLRELGAVGLQTVVPVVEES